MADDRLQNAGRAYGIIGRGVNGQDGVAGGAKRAGEMDCKSALAGTRGAGDYQSVHSSIQHRRKDTLQIPPPVHEALCISFRHAWQCRLLFADCGGNAFISLGVEEPQPITGFITCRIKDGKGSDHSRFLARFPGLNGRSF